MGVMVAATKVSSSSQKWSGFGKTIKLDGDNLIPQVKGPIAC